MSNDPRQPILNVIDTLAERYLKGKVKTIKLAMISLLSGGHLLLEDIPGLGKTTLALALAHALGLSFGRIQCTSDLLPSDITGLSVYDRNNGEFNFIERSIKKQIYPSNVRTKFKFSFGAVSLSTARSVVRLADADDRRRRSGEARGRRAPGAEGSVSAASPPLPLSTPSQSARPMA